MGPARGASGFFLYPLLAKEGTVLLRLPLATSPVITASMLYDLVVCPHRVIMDLVADPVDRDWTHPQL